MEPLHLKPFSRDRARAGIRESQARIRRDVESILHTVLSSRGTIQAAREAIEGADDTLARRLTERG